MGHFYIFEAVGDVTFFFPEVIYFCLYKQLAFQDHLNSTPLRLLEAGVCFFEMAGLFLYIIPAVS